MNLGKPRLENGRCKCGKRGHEPSVNPTVLLVRIIFFKLLQEPPIVELPPDDERDAIDPSPTEGVLKDDNTTDLETNVIDDAVTATKGLVWLFLKNRFFKLDLTSGQTNL